ncbi:glucose-6-phosphate exchanger SLC37A4 [Caerostris darwini]|uniref:Glucose-6-phosphate exchanger SLC37A4 n=1 Tax=Caerostris darwini TaxID=1538125 RepID=A0AAV4TED6_9ARAC|nr:glucose-6-phosphate exchanger SLC37A4 [Caerostris darwini]
MGDKLRTYQISIFTMLFVGYACYAYNRKSVSLALPKLMEEGLDKNQAGLIISCQNVAYAISKFLGGILSDRISARILFSTGLTFCGLVTLLFASSSSVAVFSLLWFLNGFGQGCGWPACSKILRQWFSPTQFGTWWSVLSASANISGGLSPFFTAFLVLNYGWRFSLFLAGSVSVGLGFVALFALVNSPVDVGLPSFQATGEKKDKGEASSGEATVGDLLRCPSLWLVSFCYMVVFCAKTGTVDWGQLYLLEDRKHTQYVASAFTSSVESGGFLGGILAGYLTDLVLKSRSPDASKERGNPRMPMAAFFMVGVLGCLHLLQFSITEESSQLWISTIGFLLGAGFYGPIAIYGVVASESAPIHLSGTSHAVVALAANVGAIISGLPFSYIAKYYNWSAIFFILEITTAVNLVIMFLCRNLNYNMAKKKVD